MSSRRSSPGLPAIATGLRSAFRAGYGLTDLRKDLMAGLTVGTVAVPLSMALAIATGVPPQHGLYTAIVAGFIIALTGGSRFNVSGPTAAFVVILFPIVQQYGLGGLLLATMMAGLILVAMGALRMGRLIQFVPYPVVLGFTAGIAAVIMVLQIPDFMGLDTGGLGEHFIDNLVLIVRALPTLTPTELGVGVFALAVMLAWPRTRIPIPAPLIGLFVGALAAYALNVWLAASDPDLAVATIASRFSWEIDGQVGAGIPPIAPSLVLPWLLPGPDGEALAVNFDLIRSLLGPAFAIAMLGAIESLLCAVVADGLSNTRHDPNAELIGQGLGNLAAPLFGGITATAAIARTATAVRSGARSPIAAMIHALVVLLAVVAVAGLLGLVPMAALAALLFIVAWNMSEPRRLLRTLRSAPAEDVAILLLCFALTVVFDMVIAVAVGVGLAGAMFIRRMALLTQADQIDARSRPEMGELPSGVAVYEVNGPLFFGAADRALSTLHVVDPGIRTVIVDLSDVPSIDGTAVVALQTLIADLNRGGVRLILLGLSTPLIAQLRRAGVRKLAGRLSYCRGWEQARQVVERWHAADAPS